MLTRLANWVDDMVDAFLERVSKSLDEAVAADKIVDMLASMEPDERSELLKELIDMAPDERSKAAIKKLIEKAFIT